MINPGISILGFTFFKKYFKKSIVYSNKCFSFDISNHNQKPKT